MNDADRAIVAAAEERDRALHCPVGLLWTTSHKPYNVCDGRHDAPTPAVEPRTAAAGPGMAHGATGRPVEAPGRSQTGEEYRVRDTDGDREPVTEVMFQPCPVCGDPARVTLTETWQNLVNEHNGVIPIVGCGNPWHYGLHEAGALLARPRETEPPSIADGPSVSDQSLAELERLARAATPSPWFSQPSEDEPPLGVVYGPDGDSFASIAWNPGNDYDPVATAAFIAAASPDVVLRLLARRAPGDREREPRYLRALDDDENPILLEYQPGQDTNPTVWVRALAADSRPEQPRPLHSDPAMQARCDGHCAGDECVCAVRPEEPPE